MRFKMSDDSIVVVNDETDADEYIGKIDERIAKVEQEAQEAIGKLRDDKGKLKKAKTVFRRMEAVPAE